MLRSVRREHVIDLLQKFLLTARGAEHEVIAGGGEKVQLAKRALKIKIILPVVEGKVGVKDQIILRHIARRLQRHESFRSKRKSSSYYGRKRPGQKDRKL